MFPLSAVPTKKKKNQRATALSGIDSNVRGKRGMEFRCRVVNASLEIPANAPGHSRSRGNRFDLTFSTMNSPGVF